MRNALINSTYAKKLIQILKNKSTQFFIEIVDFYKIFEIEVEKINQLKNSDDKKNRETYRIVK